MKLNDLAGLLSAEGGVSAAAEVTGVTSDSRKVAPGMVFVAVAGSKADGAAYAADAARRGCGGNRRREERVDRRSVGAGVFSSTTRGSRWRNSPRSIFPRQPATMVAVTGTSGKTSVASFTRQIWEQAGHRRRQHRHHRRRRARPQRLRLAHHARSGRTAQASHRTRRCRRHPRRDGGLQPRPRPAPARRRQARGRRLHQSRPRPHGLSSDRRGLSSRQAAPVRHAAAQGRAGRDLRRRPLVEADDRCGEGRRARTC